MQKIDFTWVDVVNPREGRRKLGISDTGTPGEGVPTGGTAGQVLTKDSATNFDTSWQTPTGGGAPTDAQYLVGAADATLSDERVVTDTATVAWDLATASQAKADVVPAGIPLDDLGAPADNTDLNVSTTAHGLTPKLPNDDSLYFDGTGLYSDPRGGLATGFYRFSTDTSATDPGSGNLKLNAGTWAAATNIYIDQLTSPGTDVTAWMELIIAGDIVAIQDRGDSTKRARYIITASPTNNTGWFTIPVLIVASSGAVPNNNQTVAFSLFFGGGSIAANSQVLQYDSDPTGEGQIPPDQNSPAICYQKDGLGQMFTWNTTTHVWQ